MGKLGHIDHNWRIMHDKNGSAFFILMRYLQIFFYIFKLVFALGIQFLGKFPSQ